MQSILDLKALLLLLFVEISVFAATTGGREQSLKQWKDVAENVRNAHASQWTRASEDEKDEWFEWMNGFSELSNIESTEQKALRNNQMHRVVSNLFRPLSPKQSNPLQSTPLARKRSEESRERQTVFTCSECGHTCTRQGLLDRHWKKHTGERPYQCAFCDTRMSRSDNLLLHMEQQHGFVSGPTS